MTDTILRYQLIIYIEQPGTPTYTTTDEPGAPTGSSVAGHVWYELRNGLDRFGSGYAPGGVTDLDRNRYEGDPTFASREIPINQAQFDLLREFGLPNSSFAEKNGFGPNNYNVASNSCVDYVWKALELAGLNPGRHEGALLPMSNIDDLRKYMSLSKEEAAVIDEQIARVLKYTYDPQSNEWGRPLEEMIKEWDRLQLPRATDPLVLDLDGDGVETLSVKDGVFFNLDCAGLKEAVGWVSPDDGLLVVDLDGDGCITSGAELFGNFTMRSAGQHATEGFDALAEYDTHRDSFVDGQDAAYHRLQVWRDLNSNGLSDDGELMTLAQAGIERLNLQYDIPATRDAAGNQHRESSYFLRSDGQRHAMTDVWFAVESYRTQDSSPDLAVGDTIAALPDIAGLGNARSLHQAMVRDTSGQLIAALQAWQEAHGMERDALLEELVQRWAGVDPVPDLKSSSVMAGRQLATLETFMGLQVPMFNRGELASPTSEVNGVVHDTYSRLKAAIAGQLVDQTDLPALLTGLQWSSVNGTLEWNVAPLVSRLSNRFDTAASKTDALFDLVETLGRLRSGGLEELATAVLRHSEHGGLAFQQAMTEWGASNGILRGSDRGEGLRGTPGETSAFYGGRGNDTYSGGTGGDLIFFRPGDGHDRLYLEADGWVETGKDVLALGVGITPEDITFERRENHLVVRMSESDSVSVIDYFRAPRYRLEEIRFSDGTSWSQSDIAQRLTMVGTASRDYWVGVNEFANHMVGLGGDDEFHGGNQADLMDGGDGSDWLGSGGGDDTLIGGRGNDCLVGSWGDDVYVFSKRDGRDSLQEDGPYGGVSTDTIRFTEGITFDSLHLERQGETLKIRYGDAGDEISIYAQFRYADTAVERLQFADGSFYDLNALAQAAPVLAA